MLKEIIATIVSFLLIDIVWIQLVVNKQYRSQLPTDLLSSQPKLVPAVIFYLIFCLALWFLVIREHTTDIKMTLIKAFIFGFATYATYSLTNLAVLRGWSLNVAISDMLWGGILATLVTAVVVWLS